MGSGHPESHGTVVLQRQDSTMTCANCCSANSLPCCLRLQPCQRAPQLPPLPPSMAPSHHVNYISSGLLLPQQTHLSFSAEIQSATFGGDYVRNWDRCCKAELSSPPPLLSQVCVQEHSCVQISGFSCCGKSHRPSFSWIRFYFSS